MIIYTLAGVFVLVFLIRRFVRHRQTLEQYRDERARHAESVLASLRQANESLEPEEALQPVLAGLRELTDLHPDLVACQVSREGNTALVRVASSPPRVFELAWRVRVARLSSLENGKIVQGGGHWEVTEGQETWSFTELADVMDFWERVLRADSAEAPDAESGDLPPSSPTGGPLAN